MGDVLHTNQKQVCTNIVLIGMAGAGKSTVGRALAQQSGRMFVDVDTVIEESWNAQLQDLLSTLGVQGFRDLEEETLLTFDLEKHIIATGGSAVYSQAGMEHLKKISIILFLDVSLDLLRERVGDVSSRGLVRSGKQTFEQVFEERKPLYKKYADVTIDCTDQSVADICLSIKDRLSDTCYHL